MKLIIAGSRDIYIDELFIARLLSHFNIGGTGPELPSDLEVVCGGANGIDTCGEMWAKWQGIPVTYFPANWDKHGKSAGPIRNRDMAKYGDALLLIWDGESRGSAYMKKAMGFVSKPVYEVILKRIGNEN